MKLLMKIQKLRIQIKQLKGSAQQLHTSTFWKINYCIIDYTEVTALHIGATKRYFQ